MHARTLWIRTVPLVVVAGVLLFMAAGTHPSGAKFDASLMGLTCMGVHAGAETRLATYSGPDGGRVQWSPAYFQDCPGTADHCAMPGRLRRGQPLLVDRHYRNFVCASGIDEHGEELRGWLNAASISDIRKPDPNPPLSDWVGTYGTPDENIKITLLKDRLRIEGEAYWPAKAYTQEAGQPAQSEGGFSFDAAPVGNHLALGDHSTEDLDCRVDLDLMGPFLISSSNHACGGMNIVFWGVLKRTRP